MELLSLWVWQVLLQARCKQLSLDIWGQWDTCPHPTGHLPSPGAHQPPKLCQAVGWRRVGSDGAAGTLCLPSL